MLLGVCGWPVGHSRSPAMHNAALGAIGLHGWRYVLLPLPPERFATAVEALAGQGFRGVNVTIPHKQAALALAATATPAARAIGAANPLTFGDAGIEADNTDAPGLLAVLPPSHQPAGRSALVLGAGGSARAAAWSLKRAGANVTVWNRTPERARALAADLDVRAVDVPEDAEIVVNCTSVGLREADDPFKAIPLQADSLDAGSCVVDLVYRRGGTRLLDAARARGAEAVDGLEVLVAQGAASLERWTGRPAPRDLMREAVEDDSQTT